MPDCKIKDWLQEVFSYFDAHEQHLRLSGSLRWSYDYCSLLGMHLRQGIIELTGGEEEEDQRSFWKADEVEEATALYEIGNEQITSGTKHPGKVEGQTKRGGGEGSEERRVRARPSEQPPAKSGPPEAEKRPRAARSSGGKDRHSKVNTAKGPRDRRVRLSVPTAVQFYDVQDRLGYDQPSKAVEWLIKHAKAAIDELAQLPPVRQAGDATPEPQPQQQQAPQQQQQHSQHQQQPPPPQPQTSSVAAFSAGLPGVLATPSLHDPSQSSSYGNYDRHGQPPMVQPGVAPFAQGAMQGMELPHGGPSYGQPALDPSFAHRDPGPAGHETHMFRTGSDVAAGASSARSESRAKARERARERAKEKHHTGLERDAPPPSRAGSYVAASQAHPYLPSQVSSALQHPFQAPFHATAVNQRQPAYHHATSFNYPETFPSTAFGYPSYAPPHEPSPSSLSSVSHYFVENPPGAMGARYPTSGASGPNPNYPSFAPGPPAASSLRPGASSFSSLLNEPQYSGFPSQGYYPVASPYPSQSRPPSSSLLGQSSSSRQPQQAGTSYPPPPSHLVRPGQDRQMPLHSTSTPHSLDPNFYNPQIPNRLEGFEELEEEFKP